MRNKTLVLILFGVLALSGIAACTSQQSDQNQSDGIAKQEPAPDSGAVPATRREDEIPQPIQSAFPDALITKQHSELSESQVSSIEQKSGLQLNEADFDAFIAYGKDGDQESKLGTATIVDVEGASQPMQIAVFYKNDLAIKEVQVVEGSSDAATPEFLNQFAGKNSNQPFQVGKDVKFSGKNTEDAKALAQAVKLDALKMESVFGMPKE